MSKGERTNERRRRSKQKGKKPKSARGIERANSPRRMTKRAKEGKEPTGGGRMRANRKSEQHQNKERTGRGGETANRHRRRKSKQVEEEGRAKRWRGNSEEKEKEQTVFFSQHFNKAK